MRIDATGDSATDQQMLGYMLALFSAPGYLKVGAEFHLDFHLDFHLGFHLGFHLCSRLGSHLRFAFCVITFTVCVLDWYRRVTLVP